MDDLGKAALEAMRAVPKVGGDIEANHSRADDILCDLLRSLGHTELIDEYEAISKWYA